MKIHIPIILMLLCLSGCSTPHKSDKEYNEIYDGKHEWRAVWIATVENIDWPSSPGLSSQQQQEELIEYFDLFKEMNFNAVILQIRPTADAFYISEYEPWSIYLTGDQKNSPNPPYDPLAFAIKEAHQRGMELHAWLNPYRVLQDTADIRYMSPDHIYFKQPELFVQHGKKLYFDPAYPETRDFLAKVVKDIVIKYDLDGIHFDDYFYPYNDFEDSLSFSIHPRGYDKENKMAWRRENVNLVIEMIRETIKSVKPYVKFGISPYAVWRNLKEDPRGSDTKSYSYTNYDHLHADVLYWMEKGWLDYVLPQLYFNIGYENADFEVLANWWQDYSHGTPVYGGLGTYRLDSTAKNEAWRTAKEIEKQALLLRKMPSYQGVCYFNAKNFKENRLDINNVMKKLYPNPAVIPPMKNCPATSPTPPRNVKMQVSGNEMKIIWDEYERKDNHPSAPKYYLIYQFDANEKPDFSKGNAIIGLTGENSYVLKNSKADNNLTYYVSALNRTYNESKPVRVKK